MSLATAFWQIQLLAVLSGIGNSVIHPADYAILSGSIDKDRIGRSFAVHTFSGNVGFALGAPVTAFLMLALGCSAEEALQRMRQISQARNMKVTDVATRIIDSRGADELGAS